MLFEKINKVVLKTIIVSSQKKERLDSDKIEKKKGSSILYFLYLSLFSYLACSFLPYILIMVPSKSNWNSISGIGIKYLNPSEILISPSFITLFILKIVIVVIFSIKVTKSPLWNHFKYPWTLILLELSIMFTKRQQMLIYIEEDFISTFQAQIQEVPHSSLGFFLEFFTLIIILGIYLSMAINYEDNDFTNHINFRQIGIISIALYLLPWFLGRDEEGFHVLFGIGYGFSFDGSAYHHATSIGAWIFQFIIFVIIMLLFTSNYNKKVRWFLELCIICLFLIYLNKVGHMRFDIYKNGHSEFSILPPMTPVFCLNFYIQAQIFWDWFITSYNLSNKKKGNKIENV